MRLGPWHRWLLLASLIAVGVSGVLWFALHDLVGLAPGETLRALLVTHGVAAYAAAVAFGSVLPLHARAGCRQRRNRLSGLVSVGALALLIGSALLLYYGGEQTQAWARLVHLAVGFAAVIGVPVHVVLGWRARCRAQVAADDADYI